MYTLGEQSQANEVSVYHKGDDVLKLICFSGSSEEGEEEGDWQRSH